MSISNASAELFQSDSDEHEMERERLERSLNLMFGLPKQNNAKEDGQPIRLILCIRFECMRLSNKKSHTHTKEQIASH